MTRRVLYGAVVMVMAALLLRFEAGAVTGAAAASVTSAGPDASLLAACLVFLIPAGLTMMAAGASEEGRAATVAATGLLAIALGVTLYGLIGFGFQFGGLGMVSNLRGVQTLVSEWSPMDKVWGPGWGVIGLDGFFLFSAASSPELLTLFLYHSALAATALCIPLLALAQRLRFLALLGVSLFFSVVVYPIYGNWVWGGGWLSQLGANLGLGHGFVDFAGSGTIHATGGLVTLAGVLVLGARLERPQGREKPPAVHVPALALLGTFLVLPGWFGLVVGSPLLTGNVTHVAILVNVLLAASSGILVSALYIWFAAGSPDLLMVARGAVAALVAVSASCAFVPSWAATVIGGVAGLVLPISIYFLKTRLSLDDPIDAVAIHGISGLWGLLALGIFADGSAGRGWNGVGTREYFHRAGQGVSGLLVRAGFHPDWPGQFYAQIVGILFLLLLSLGVSWVVFRAVEGFRSRVAGVRSELRAQTERSPSED